VSLLDDVCDRLLQFTVEGMELEEAIDKARGEVSGGKDLSPGMVFEAYKERLDSEAKARPSRWIERRGHRPAGRGT
jgi:cell division septum initiation protein DivIVA